MEPDTELDFLIRIDEEDSMNGRLKDYGYCDACAAFTDQWYEEDGVRRCSLHNERLRV